MSLVFYKCLQTNRYIDVVRFWKKRKETSDKTELTKYFEEELLNLHFMSIHQKEEFLNWIIFAYMVYAILQTLPDWAKKLSKIKS